MDMFEHVQAGRLGTGLIGVLTADRLRLVRRPSCRRMLALYWLFVVRPEEQRACAAG